MSSPQHKPPAPLRPLPSMIFASRWLQLPLYLGLIVAQLVYVWHFLVELLHQQDLRAFAHEKSRSEKRLF